MNSGHGYGLFNFILEHPFRFFKFRRECRSADAYLELRIWRRIRSTASALSPDLRWAITDARTAQAFGDITAVPTLLLFDRAGKTARVLYGAPPDLHEQVGATLDAFIQ